MDQAVDHTPKGTDHRTASRACENREKAAPEPLAATLDRISTAKAGSGGRQLSARTRVPDGPGWVSVDELAADHRLLAEIMDRVGRAYGEDNRPFTGTTLVRIYLWRMLAPVVAAFLTERRLPDLRGGEVVLRFDGDGSVVDVAFVGARLAVLPRDPDASHADVVVLPSEEELLFFLRDTLAETHLAVLIPALRSLRVRRGTRALRRVFADSCAEAFMFVGRDLGREAEGRRFAEALLSGTSSPLSASANFYVLGYPGGSEWTRVRNTCCLYYKTGNGECFTCPRKTDEERVRQREEEKTSWGSEET